MAKIFSDFVRLFLCAIGIYILNVFSSYHNMPPLSLGEIVILIGLWQHMYDSKKE